jgi:hypothetical protein
VDVVAVSACAGVLVPTPPTTTAANSATATRRRPYLVIVGKCLVLSAWGGARLVPEPPQRSWPTSVENLLNWRWSRPMCESTVTQWIFNRAVAGLVQYPCDAVTSNIWLQFAA